MGLFPKHLQCIAHLMIEFGPSIVHPVQTDFCMRALIAMAFAVLELTSVDSLDPGLVV